MMMMYEVGTITVEFEIKHKKNVFKDKVNNTLAVGYRRGTNSVFVGSQHNSFDL